MGTGVINHDKFPDACYPKNLSVILYRVLRGQRVSRRRLVSFFSFSPPASCFFPFFFSFSTPSWTYFRPVSASLCLSIGVTRIDNHRSATKLSRCARYGQDEYSFLFSLLLLGRPGYDITIEILRESCTHRGRRDFRKRNNNRC